MYFIFSHDIANFEITLRIVDSRRFCLQMVQLQTAGAPACFSSLYMVNSATTRRPKRRQ